MKFIYPPIKNLSPSPNTKSVTFDDILQSSNFSNDLGSFIIGKNKVFHGGVNLIIPNGYGLQAVADGRIIAYRVSKKSQKIQHVDGGKSTELEFSNNFILVEHNFDQFKYIDFIGHGGVDNPYKSYKFYALYMHMMPLDECSQLPVLPDWLVLDKKKMADILLRGDQLTPKILSYTKGFTIANVLRKNKKIKLSQNDIVNINGDNYLNKKLEVYDISVDAIKILDKYFSTEEVVVLNDTNAIAVQAGELLGYAGKSQASSIDQTQNNFMHFEIWLENEDFLKNNINNKYASYISDLDPNFSAQKSAVFNNLNKRSLGYSYIHSNRAHTLESLSFEMIDTVTPLYMNVRAKGSLSVSTGEATLFKTSVLNNSVSTLYTDADWLDHPINKWKIYSQSDFFNLDGSIKEKEFKEQFSKSNIWKKLQDKAVIKLEYSEWDKLFFEQKYSFLLTKKSKYFSKIDPNTFEVLRKYQDSVSFLDKTATSTLVPKLGRMYVINPIEFLMQLKRCMLPGPPTANTHLVKRLVQYALDENIYLLQILLKKMDAWIAGGTDLDLDRKFLLWFGYRRGVVARTTATSIVYQDSTPPNVTDFDIARKIVREHLASALKVIQHLNYEKLCFGWGLDAGAFVYPTDLNHNVHLGFQMFPLTAVDNANQVNTNENFSIPLFRRTAAGEVGFVNCFLHESLHFAIKNSAIKNASILSSMYSLDANYKYLNDIHVDYIDINSTTISFGAYGLSECKKLAFDIPSATLANSDSYAEFFSEVMETSRPTLQYRGI